MCENEESNTDNVKEYSDSMVISASSGSFGTPCFLQRGKQGGSG